MSVYTIEGQIKEMGGMRCGENVRYVWTCATKGYAKLGDETERRIAESGALVGEIGGPYAGGSVNCDRIFYDLLVKRRYCFSESNAIYFI